ncbi:MAG: (2Fe-2S)-binding protein [Deltaproteobacteria bacterium]|nr:(2Fe-2S)-binding protein [Deltaproteobacteria bacterium]
MNRVTCTIDGQTVTVPEGTALIEAARALGIEIPHFCYHPHLPVAGNCRMCVVEIQGSPKLEIACNTAAREGMAVRTDTEAVRAARRANMEFLLANHPLDCPICDQSGECLLQEYWDAHARHASRLRDPKVTKGKRIDLGDDLVLDQERCIACTRCVRFSETVTRTGDLVLLGRSDHQRIGPATGARITHAYQGCLAEICPVGALTSRSFRFRKRVWWLEEVDSICPGCATGCNVRVCVQDDTVHRILARRNDAVNRSWACDEGRGLYRELAAPERPLLGRVAGRPAAREEALAAAAARLGSARRPGLVLGGQATCEALLALVRLHERALPAARLFHVPGPDPGRRAWSDGILVHADKDPDTRGVRLLATCAGGVEDGEALARALADEALDLLLVLEDDALGRLGIPAAPGVVALAFHGHRSAAAAEVLVPVAGCWEQDGTYVNAAGRVQRLHRAVRPAGEAVPAYVALHRLGALLGVDLGCSTSEAAAGALAETISGFPREVGPEGVVLPPPLDGGTP